MKQNRFGPQIALADHLQIANSLQTHTKDFFMKIVLKSVVTILALSLFSAQGFAQGSSAPMHEPTSGTGTMTGKGMNGDSTTNEATHDKMKKKNRRAKGNKNDTSTTNPGSTSDTHTNAMPNQNH